MQYIPVPRPWAETAQVLRTSVPFVTEALCILPLYAVEGYKNAACTDEISITICPATYDTIERNTLAAGLPWFPTPGCGRAIVLIHECWHITGKHLTRRGNRNKKLYQRAADIVANCAAVGVLMMEPFNYSGEKLEKLKAVMAATFHWEPRFDGLSVEEVYDALLAEQGAPPEDDGDEEDGDGGSSDTGSPQQPSDSRTKEGAKPSDTESQDQEGGDANGTDNGDRPVDIRDLFGEDFGEGVPNSPTPEDLGGLIADTMANYMERHGNKLNSRGGSGLSREIDQAAKKPPVPMSLIMRKIRDLVPQYEYRYDRIGRNDAWMLRNGMNYRMPSPHRSPSDLLREAVLAVDASGSMSNEELALANRMGLEVLGRTKGRKVRRIIFTDRICDSRIVTPEDMPPIRHTGGTNIGVVIDEIERLRIRPSVIVLITDAWDEAKTIARFERWKHLPQLRTIIIRNPGATFPGIHFHADVID